jgi:hypothetical protein
MPKSDERLGPLSPSTAPIFTSDFPGVLRKPSSGFRPPSDRSATPDKVAQAASDPAEPATPEDAIKDELRRKNARLREKIDQILELHPELRDATEEIALRQGLDVQVGVPFLERIQRKLQERGRAIIERRPDLEHLFDD